ncbi:MULTISPECIES: hypothetical protein [Arthrospira]|jgi:nickel transport protein|uniref:Uncharacterized protein n=1 Tax=Limnospira platensis NIES-46 TaxID=1236695 RepID=A0A5M3TA87_LIMPL|nr:hypothetical protein [Arthrospira platensis]AMW30171.1 hypothetical protein AP285_21810 [Arthrospira platensis YZ]KDR54123.1 hypothetical protein APPUASWS_031785 [Arthrospira platensis str. Paraca]MBD2670504.1 hypothetical protein [Arthrospira platensis FACHB-439]MBD2711768.1 hypothetical protein [Arthrospira platensis FACHB-835]MDF2207929.1 hypothetical protein [Arthrospira platensis NCB002]MDT9183621.1 hypothetical protein [Limnospira sp. PMC 289.06]MDT9295775.1 hypothetical protein [Ar
MKFKQFLVAIAIFISLLGFPGDALAHSVLTNYHLQGEALEIEAVFSTGEAFYNADVVVHPPADSNLPETKGLTDENGLFLFEPDYSVMGSWAVEIGEGSHWDKLMIPISDRIIDLNAISQIHYHSPQRHHHFGNQIIVAEIALCFGLFGHFMKNKIRF